MRSFVSNHSKDIKLICEEYRDRGPHSNRVRWNSAIYNTSDGTDKLKVKRYMYAQCDVPFITYWIAWYRLFRRSRETWQPISRRRWGEQERCPHGHLLRLAAPMTRISDLRISNDTSVIDNIQWYPLLSIFVSRVSTLSGTLFCKFCRSNIN